MCFLVEVFFWEKLHLPLLWLGNPLYRPLSVSIDTVADAGPYQLPSMIFFWCINCPFSCPFEFAHAFYHVCLVFCNDEIYFGMSAHCSRGWHCNLVVRTTFSRDYCTGYFSAPDTLARGFSLYPYCWKSMITL